MRLECFHGTSFNAAETIHATEFAASNNQDDWLGFGVYFFVDGISDPLENAKRWAVNAAWDNSRRDYRYTRYSVLKCEMDLDPEYLLDLKDIEGLKNFNELKESLLNKILALFKTKERDLSHDNCKLFNFIVKELGIHAVIHNLYIKDTEERKLQLRLNVPNTTVLCVGSDFLKVVTKQIVFTGQTK